ncbi:hypothetical protein J4E83_011066 [Alternaria metachromatica]|uniref:uncharacterized protein n=1 Tax=Alternaria metachromatica TaxID=283354 RepID=UPI0020C389B7|nr:uncharacterized protein J4E83_011066 [Alternaria metachromatica]KAI4604595.1 hypothetical protein J4E83_011066 [Alternaria metachromatica]
MKTPSKPASTGRPWMKPDSVSGVLRNSFEYVYGKLKLVNGRVDGMEAQMTHLKQLVEDVKIKSEADNQALQSDIDAQKAQNQQLRNELDAERDRNQRLETTIKDSQQSITRTGQQLNDLSNKFHAHETIADAKLQRTDRIVPDLTQRIESLKRSGNTYSQSIVELRNHLEDRFETAVVHTQESLRHNKTAWIKGLELLRSETAEKLATTTDHFSTAVDTVQAQSREHTEAFEKTALVLDRNSQRIEELEKAMEEPQFLEGMKHRVEELENAVESRDAALQASQAITTRLESLDARLGVSEVALHSIRTPNMTPPTTTTATAALDDPQNKVDAVYLQLKNELASLSNCKDRLVALEKHRGTPASRKLDNRVCVLEENYGKMRNDHTDMTAKCVTHEQLAAARDSLATSLHTTIHDHRDEVNQGMAYNVGVLNERWGGHLKNIETSLTKVVKDNVFPVSTYHIISMMSAYDRRLTNRTSTYFKTQKAHSLPEHRHHSQRIHHHPR